MFLLLYPLVNSILLLMFPNFFHFFGWRDIDYVITHKSMGNCNKHNNTWLDQIAFVVWGTTV